VSDDETTRGSTHPSWLVPLAIVVGAAMIVASVLLLRDDPCGSWQDEVRAAKEDALAVFDRIEDPPEENAAERDALTAEAIAIGARLERLEGERPGGCEEPD